MKKKRNFRTVKRHNVNKNKPFNGFNTMSITNANLDMSPLGNKMI